MADPRAEVVARFRSFLARHAFTCVHADGTEMDDSMIMTLVGDLMGTFRRVADEDKPQLFTWPEAIEAVLTRYYGVDEWNYEARRAVAVEAGLVVECEHGCTEDLYEGQAHNCGESHD